MVTNYNPQLKRRMTAPERVLLMLPLNVVMVAKIRGSIDVERLTAILDGLRKRHALLAVRVVIDEKNNAWYVTEGVPKFTVTTIPRQTEEQCLQVAVKEWQISFPIETGPLVRFSLLHSSDRTDLVICAHHAICDGISLTYLIRDILRQLAEPDRAAEILPEPPAITRDTVPSPPPSNLIAKGVIGVFNKLWARQNISFNSDDLKQLHQVFWEQNRAAGLLAWEISVAETKALVSRCRAENVTINTALWTTFLAAQHDVQGDAEPYRPSAGLAVSTRDKLNVPVGEAFGFYAASLTTQLRYEPHRTFWDSARIFHEKIKDSLAQTNIFRSLSAELLAPTLLDSLYFSKYGLIKSRLSDKLVQQMNWQGLNYGYAITNVGRMHIPTTYDQYQLESVYGPIVYSDVNEKTVGVITVGDKVTFLMSYNQTIVAPATAEKIRKTTMDYLSNAVRSR